MIGNLVIVLGILAAAYLWHGTNGVLWALVGLAVLVLAHRFIDHWVND